MLTALRMRLVFAIIVLSLSLVPAAFAQTENATLSGVILDPNGAVVPDAEVTALRIETNTVVTTKTNGAGIYVLTSLMPGHYHMQIRKPGFKEIALETFELYTQDKLQQNFTLEIGSMSESVTVDASGININTIDGSVSTVVDRQFVQNIPLNGRSFQTLIQLTPGVVFVPGGNAANQGQFSVNGQRADANYVTVDGASANIGLSTGPLAQTAGGSVPGFNIQGSTNSLVSVDALQEFRIQTSTFAPEFGRTPGAQISLVTRSGTNQFHGTAFDYFRNDVLDANDWFSNRSGLPKPKDRQNDFGGVIGGPIVKDRTFFFFSYEGLRLRQPLSATTVVPSTNSPTPSLDRAAAPAPVQPFLNAYPIPNGPDLGSGFARFTASYSNPSSLDAYSIRIDHALTSKLNLFGRLSDSPSVSEIRNSSFLSTVETLKTTIQTLTIGLTESITPTMNNEVRTNYSRVTTFSGFQLDTFGGAVPVPDSLLFPSGFSSANAEYSWSIAGAGAVTTGKIGANKLQQVNLVDNFSFIRGAHQLKFGADYRRLPSLYGPRPYIQLVGFSGMVGPTGALAAQTQSIIVSAQQSSLDLLARNFSFYGQDTWKATQRLNVTYGLRWDVNPALTGNSAATDPVALLQPTETPADIALAPRGTPLYKTTWGNVAPRIGAAYQVSQKQGWETILRGGYGVFYDLGSGLLGGVNSGFPFVGSKLFGSVPFPLTPQQAAPPAITSALPTSSPVISAEPNLKLPRTYQWNFAVEQALGVNQTLSATYVGAMGRDLLRNEGFLDPNPSFTQTVQITDNTGSSDYHALELKLQRKLSRGLQALASYTWSHSIDNASADSGGGNFPLVLGNPNVDRGNSDFDVRHSFSAAVTWDVPAPWRQTAMRTLLGGWSFDDLIIARSALPVNVTGTTFIGSGLSIVPRPNVVPGMPLYLYGPQYPGGKVLNNTPNQGGPGCKGPFCRTTGGQEGNLGRNSLRAFPAWQTNLAVRRQFNVTERVGLQFRAEFFNLFNHPTFGAPTGSLSSPLFGQSTQTLASSLGGSPGSGSLNSLYQVGGPRSIQLALRLTF
jgi:hypothetical protein